MNLRPSIHRVLACRIAAWVAAVAVADTVSAQQLIRAWRRPVSPVHSMAISPSGSAVAASYLSGKAHVYGRDGKLIQGFTFLRPQSIAVCDSGRFAVAYTPRHPSRTVVTLLSDGRASTRKLDGGITGAAIGPEGRLIGVATDRRWLYLFRRENGVFHASRQHLRTALRTLVIPRDGFLVAGYRDRGGVEAFGPDGRVRWRLPVEKGRVCDVVSGLDGHTIGILSYRAVSGDQIHAYVVASSGDLIWKTDVEGIYPRMMLDPDGTGAAVGSTVVLRSGDTSRYYNQICYYSSAGRLLWKKGGLVFSPRLIGVTAPGPTVLARSAGADFYVLGSRGTVQRIMKSRVAPIRIEASRDGRCLFLWGQDSALHFYRYEE